MAAETIYLVSVWSLQAILYFSLTLGFVNWNIKKKTIFWIAVGLFLIAPWIFKIKGGYDPDTGAYVCGLAGLIPISIFWFLGNIGNMIILLVFAGFGRLIKKYYAQPQRH